MRTTSFPFTCSLLVAAGWCSTSHAELAPRLSVDQRGDFVLVGNTLAHNCADGVDEPVVGTVGNCGAQQDDTGADVLWSVAADGATATANTGVSPAEASSRAVLALPEGASVTHAELYWSAPSGGGDNTAVTFARAGAFSEALVARASTTVALDELQLYQSSADVTALVREHGVGAYQVSGIDAADPVGLDSSAYYAGWWLVVLYGLDSEPLRHLAVYDGLELVVDEDTAASATLSGFAIPDGPSTAKLGVVGYEGDFGTDGDELRFGPAAPLPGTAALDGSDNFFDGSRRGLDGAAFGVAGDLPRTTGAGESLSGVDLHVVDVAASFAPGQTSAEILATTTGDRFVLSGLVLSVETATPDLQQSTQSVVDVNGPPLRPGDELEYTVSVRNGGTGAALGVTLAEVLPESVVYVPGTLQIVAGPGAGVLTDAADVDAGELAAATAETLVVRLGAGADASAGGRLAPGESSEVVYRVSVAPAASGSIRAQGQISARGEAGAASTALTDADLAAPGVTPTIVVVDACATDVDCAPTGGQCDVGQSPHVCVECLEDASCAGLLPTCDVSLHECVCVAAAEETLCDGKDDDCDGVIDEGFTGGECSAGVGACQAFGVMICDRAGSSVCGATPTQPVPEVCSNGVDDDCDGQTDAADEDCESPGDGASGGSEFPAVVDLGGDLLDPGGKETGAAEPVPPTSSPGSSGPSTALGDGPAGPQLGGGGGCGFRAASPESAAWLALGTGTLLLRRRRGRPRSRRGGRLAGN
jgi:clumping factor A